MRDYIDAVIRTFVPMVQSEERMRRRARLRGRRATFVPLPHEAVLLRAR